MSGPQTPRDAFYDGVPFKGDKRLSPDFVDVVEVRPTATVHRLKVRPESDRDKFYDAVHPGWLKL